MDKLSHAEVIEGLMAAADQCAEAGKPLDAARYIQAASAYAHLCKPKELPDRSAIKPVIDRELDRMIAKAEEVDGKAAVKEFIGSIAIPYLNVQAIGRFAMEQVTEPAKELLLALVCKQIIDRASYYPEDRRESDAEGVPGDHRPPRVADDA